MNSRRFMLFPKLRPILTAYTGIVEGGLCPLGHVRLKTSRWSKILEWGRKRSMVVCGSRAKKRRQPEPRNEKPRRAGEPGSSSLLLEGVTRTHAALRRQVNAADPRPSTFSSFWVFISLCGPVGLRICAGFRQLRQKLIGFLLFSERLVEELDRVTHVEVSRPSAQRAVARDFIVLDRLAGGDQTGIEGVTVPKVLHDLLSLLDDAFDRLAGLSRSFLAEHFEHLFQALDMTFRLLAMLQERFFKVLGFGRFRHFGQRAHDGLFGVIDVLQRRHKKIVEGLLGHERTPHWCRSINRAAEPRFPAQIRAIREGRRCSAGRHGFRGPRALRRRSRPITGGHESGGFSGAKLEREMRRVSAGPVPTDKF